MTNAAAVSYARLWTSCTNRIVMLHKFSSAFSVPCLILFCTVFPVYSLSVFLCFYVCVCFYVTALVCCFMGLPELKGMMNDDDDDDE